MATIQKRADELKPGDVVTLGAHGECSLLYADNVHMQFGSHSGKGLIMISFDLDHYTEFRVEAPDLTPAQQHAEELACLLKFANDTLSNYPNLRTSEFNRARLELSEKATPLLDKVKPPEPPTLEEALASLSKMYEAIAPEAASDSDLLAAESVLRRAGILK